MNAMQIMLTFMAVSRIVDAIKGDVKTRQALLVAVRKEIARLILTGRLPKSMKYVPDHVINLILDAMPDYADTSDFLDDEEPAKEPTKEPETVEPETVVLDLSPSA